MRKCSSWAGVVALIAALSAGLAGCGQIAKVKGKLAFKEANTLYKRRELLGRRQEIRGSD